MLSKLKSQFEELRSKVVFLDCVKKYLEVMTKLYDFPTLLCLILNYFDPLIWSLVFLQILSVDQWGLEVSLLPSLAACGPGSLNLQSSQDPSVLCFGTKGKSTLQAGSPLGLMAYLYARYYWWGFNRCVRTIAFLQSSHEAVQMSQSVISFLLFIILICPTKGFSQGLRSENYQTERNWRLMFFLKTGVSSQLR